MNADKNYLNLRKQISKNIKKFRLNTGLSKKEVANRAKISYSEYLLIENNKMLNPNLITLIKIAEALGVKLHELAQK